MSAMPHRRPAALGPALLAAAVLLQIALVWAFPFPPTQDGGVHLANARLLLDYHRPGHELARAYYEPPSLLAPNAALHALLAGLMTFAPPATAERLCVSLYLLLFAGAVVWACGPEGRWAVPLALPFALGYLFHLGFYSFGFGVAAFLLAAGLWVRRPEPGPVGGAAWLAIVLLAWLAHPATGAAAWLCLAAASGWLAVQRLAGGADPAGWRLARPLLFVAAGGIPLLLLGLWLRRLQGPVTPVAWPLSRRILALVTLDVLPAFDRREQALGLLLAGALVVIAVLALRARRRPGRAAPAADGLLAGAGALAALALVAPNRYATPTGGTGGGWIVHRLWLLVLLLAVAWLARQPVGAAVRRRVFAFGLLLIAAQLALHAASYVRHHDLLADVAAAEQVLPPATSFVAVVLDDRGVPGNAVSAKVATFEHVGARLALAGGRVDLGNYQATTRWQFPLAWRPERDPGLHMPPIAGLPRGVRAPDFRHYETATPGRVDHVLVWGAAAADPEDPRLAPLFGRLDEAYVPAWTSPRGLLAIYERRRAAAPASPP